MLFKSGGIYWDPPMQSGLNRKLPTHSGQSTGMIKQEMDCTAAIATLRLRERSDSCSQNVRAGPLIFLELAYMHLLDMKVSFMKVSSTCVFTVHVHVHVYRYPCCYLKYIYGACNYFLCLQRSRNPSTTAKMQLTISRVK